MHKRVPHIKYTYIVSWTSSIWEKHKNAKSGVKAMQAISFNDKGEKKHLYQVSIFKNKKKN